MLIRFTLNGKSVAAELPPERRLLDVLREDFLLTGTKEACGEGECGACTILLDGEAVHACLIPVGQVEGRSVETIEGLAENGQLDVIQQAFSDHAAIQCGFCTPGFLMTAVEILESGKEYSDAELRKLLSGHLCRCTGYENILRAVKKTMYRRLGKEMP